MKAGHGGKRFMKAPEQWLSLERMGLGYRRGVERASGLANSLGKGLV